MLNKIQILKSLSDKKDYYKSNFYVDKIALVGSYARDENNESSDIDLMVFFSKEASSHRIFRLYINLQADLSAYFNKKVDIIANGKVLPAFKEIVESEAIYV